MTKFEEKTGAKAIYPVFHMSQGMAAIQAAYDKAAEANGGNWPNEDQVIEAMAGLEFQGLGRPVTLREDHQGIEAQLMGTSVQNGDLPFATLENMMIFDGAELTTPVGEESVAWVATLQPGWADSLTVETFGN